MKKSIDKKMNNCSKKSEEIIDIDVGGDIIPKKHQEGKF